MGRAELLDLVDGYLAGTLTSERLAALEGALQVQTQARRLFAIAIQHEILLRQYAFEQLAPAAIPPGAPAQPAGLPAPVWWRTGAARGTAAALLMLAVGGLLIRSMPPPRAPTAAQALAHLVAVHDDGAGGNGTLEHVDLAAPPPGAPASTDMVGPLPPPPHQLYPGLALADGDRLALQRGAAAELRLDLEDTTISVAGGSMLSLLKGPDGVQLTLGQGLVSAVVAHQAAGRHFTIITSEATIVVIGTRLSVSRERAHTVVAVDEGHVLVRSGAATAAVDAGEHVEVGPGSPLAVAAAPAIAWSDRRPIGLMMLSTAGSGWSGNPRGWFNDPALTIDGPQGRTDFARRCDEMVERTIGILHAMDAQGVVFWDLEGRELPLGYVGDPRLLARQAPEMEANCDRMLARLRAAGFAIGMAVRTQAVHLDLWPPRAAHVQAVADPEFQVAARIAYARARWGATIFPLLGDAGAMGMGELCRRVLATAHPSAPAILLMPVADGEEAYRWSAPWQDPASPAAATPAVARRAFAGAFGVFKTLERDDLERDRDQLVQAVAAGDILTFRAWYPDPTHAQLRAILAAGAAARATAPAPSRTPP